MALGPAFATAFLASSVEAVEAATVVLAAGIARGWRTAFAGAAAGAALLAAIVALVGPAISRIPLPVLQVTTGALLLLFGMRWLRKAILRYAGAIAMRDEEAIYQRSLEAFGDTPPRGRIDALSALAVLKVVVLEGIEVIVIVLGLGASGDLLGEASGGALAACALVALAAALVHRPLARVPENALKLAVGVMVSAFGTFWFAQGVGIAWPHGDAIIPVLIATLLAASLAAIRLARHVLKPAARDLTP
jgi:uncharacterized membrane protein